MEGWGKTTNLIFLISFSWEISPWERGSWRQLASLVLISFRPIFLYHLHQLIIFYCPCRRNQENITAACSWGLNFCLQLSPNSDPNQTVLGLIVFTTYSLFFFIFLFPSIPFSFWLYSYGPTKCPKKETLSSLEGKQCKFFRFFFFLSLFCIGMFLPWSSNLHVVSFSLYWLHNLFSIFSRYCFLNKNSIYWW